MVYAALYNWRDGAAREADESLGYVMSRAVMLEMAKRGPDTKLKVLAIRHLSPVAVAAADKLASVVIEAKKQAAAVSQRSAPLRCLCCVFL